MLKFDNANLKYFLKIKVFLSNDFMVEYHHNLWYTCIKEKKNGFDDIRYQKAAEVISSLTGHKISEENIS